MKEMTYDFATHSLYYEYIDINVPIFSLAIETLEMVFEVQTGRLLGVQGFFPLIHACKDDIIFSASEKGDYLLNGDNLCRCKQNAVYDLIQKIPDTRKYFERMSIKYDKERGIIEIGETAKEKDRIIEVNENLFCALDSNSILKCIYILPATFINKK